MSQIFTPGMSPEDLRTKLRDLTRNTKDSHQTYDMRYPAWGLGLISFQPNAESKNVVADVMMTVPPGAEPPRNGDTLVIPLKKGNKPAVGMLFDAVPVSGDWIGDAYQVHVVQNNPVQAIGHEFNDLKKGASVAGRG